MPPVEVKTPVEKKEEPKKSEENIKLWNDSEVQLLKKWGETAASYRLLHDRAYRHYNIRSYWYAVPVIVLSTITGTASFSQTLFPQDLQPYVPMVIGGVNIFIGILGTLARFFRVDELTEAHRVASVSYGKFSRNIATELSLPPQNRKYHGADLVEMCRTEMDRLIEQSPVIPMNILLAFKNNEEYKLIAKPEILDIKPIEEYKVSKEEKVADIVTTVVEKLRQNKPEKTFVQQMAEKHGTSTSPPVANPFANTFVPPRPTPLAQANQISQMIRKGVDKVNQISNDVKGAIDVTSNAAVVRGEEAMDQVDQNVVQIAKEQKEKINEELNEIVNSNVVSNARAKFQGLMKKNISKDQLKAMTQNIVSTAVKAGESAIADVEMGIVHAQEEIQKEKSDEEK